MPRRRAMPMTEYAPAYPHDPPAAIGPDLFMVRGSIKMNPLVRITRNMAVVRHDGELTLINPIRLTPRGETQLRSLGGIRRIMRLGAFHGIDDPYYVDTFGAEFWSQPGGKAYPGPAIDRELGPGHELPFPNAELFCFEGTVHPEAALLLKSDGGLLLTCDAIQHYGDYRHNNLLARMMMPFIGFPKTTLVGPIWLKAMTPPGGSLKREFERLLELEFDRLLGAHGSLLAGGARDAVAVALKRALG